MIDIASLVIAVLIGLLAPLILNLLPDSNRSKKANSCRASLLKMSHKTYLISVVALLPLLLLFDLTALFEIEAYIYVGLLVSMVTVCAYLARHKDMGDR